MEPEGTRTRASGARWGTASLTVEKTPRAFVRRVSSKRVYDSVSSDIPPGVPWLTPALAITTSIGPPTRAAVSIRRSTSYSSRMSARTASTASYSAATVSIDSESLAHATTVAPSSANARTHAAPMPLLPPVITTVVSSMSRG